jgi:hypothetical protein
MFLLRDCLPERLQQRIQKELGRDESLRLLWPALVGRQLANNTRPTGLRNGTLVIIVADRTWERSLGGIEAMIRDAVNRFYGEQACRAIEFRPADVKEGGRMRTLPVSPAPAGIRKGSGLPLLNLPVEAIADAGLRDKFLHSARKYFAWQEARPK